MPGGQGSAKRTGEPTDEEETHGNYCNGAGGYWYAPEKPSEYRPGGPATRPGWKGPTAASEGVKDGSAHLTAFAKVVYGVGLEDGLR